MSIKTLRKRIALVAVSALGAGLISVVVAPTASAATADVTADTLWVATTNASTVAPVVTALGGDTALDKSKGFLAVTSGGTVQAAGTGLTGGATGTAVALQTSQLVFNTAGGAATDRVTLVASGGTLSGASSARVSIATIATVNATDIVTVTTTGAHGLSVGDVINIDAQLNIADSTAATILSTANATTFTYNNGAGINADTAAQADNGNFTVALSYNGSATAILRSNGQNPVLAAIATPNAGATSMTVSAYKGTSLTTSLPTNGTLIGSWVITLASSAATGDFSAALSAVAVTTSATAAAITTSVDASTSGITAGNPLFIQVVANNPYGQALSSGTMVATATNGAVVNWGALARGGNGSATAAGTLSTAILSSPDGSDQLRIDPASSLTTSTTTVTITHNGVPVTTKTLTFYGEAKTITIESVSSGRNGTSATAGTDTGTAYAIYSYRDSAGNRVPGAAATFDALSATSIVATGTNSRAPSAGVQAQPATTALATAVEDLIGAGRDGVFAFNCGTTSATTTVSIQHTNAISLATIKAPVTIACNGGIDTFTVSTDKASYAVGEIATITIDAKDSSGNAVSNNTTLPAGSVSVGGGALTATIAGTEVFTAGKRTLKAQVTTAGTFNTVVSIAGTTTGSATATYKVSDGAVSNTEVLAAIVKLIASINKQIRALQKSLRR